MRDKIFSFFILFLIFVSSPVFSMTENSVKQSRNLHTVYFEGTDYELHVYKIYGEKKGKTIMMIGGIQGDEPGGFLTADSYADMSLEKGTLIVVPRANLPSIILQKRLVNVDMNRKFGDDDARVYEGKIVKILKGLISESDCLLNLHDGSGFFSPVWISHMKNPMRFGQSVIADFKSYTAKNGKTLNLESMANRVIKRVNQKIEKESLYFRFNNHRTSDPDSPHKEQRKSATFYAVTKCSIPAFGIETSKSLSLMQKVKYHQYVINSFFKEFDVIPATPSLRLEKPELNYIVVSIDKNTPIVVKKGSTVTLKKGSLLEISHIEANYDRGLTVDVKGAGRKNDLRNQIPIYNDTTIIAKKDSEPCGSVFVRALDEDTIGEDMASGISISHGLKGVFFFKMMVNGKTLFLNNGDSVSIIPGDIFELSDIVTTDYDPALCKVNIKGYSNSISNNTGEDRGFKIDSSKDLWKRYSIDKKGEVYPVEVKFAHKIIAKMFIHIKKKEKKYLLVKSPSGDLIAVEEGASFKISSGEGSCLYDFSGMTDFDSWLEVNNIKIAKKDMPLSISKDIFGSLKGKMNIFLCRDIAGVRTVEAQFTLIR